MTTDRPELEAYLAAVRRELADLETEEREDLLAEVETSLLEAAEESDAPIAARLGPPADFAAELRAAAGLAEVPHAARPSRRLVDAWRSPRTAAARRTLAELAPVWWVVRGYVVVALLAWIGDASWSFAVPLVPRFGSAELGLVVLAAAVIGSIAVGFWERRHTRTAPVAVALNLLLAVAAFPLAAELLDRVENRPVTTVYTVESTATPGLAVDGVPVENVYPYSRAGRLLLDVLLYDQFGRPLNVRAASPDPNRRLLRAANGAEIYNSFPIRYFEPGTRRVDRPGAAPAIPWSPVTTPALERRKPER